MPSPETSADAATHHDLPALAGRWHSTGILKRDVFSTIERGQFATDAGAVSSVLRRTDRVPWWSKLIARHFLGREARALRRLGPLGIAPPLLFRSGDFLVRGWLPGTALHIARPEGDTGYFRSAKAALRRMHRAGICHNDLAKEQNWLRGADGGAYLTDFQLSLAFANRSPLFRLAAYEDLRHLLKHKRRYVPAALTAVERRILARKSLIARTWLATGKRVYLFVTRGVLGFTDREGAGPRLVKDAPTLTEALRRHPSVQDVAIVPYPDRRFGTGLYAFVESEAATERGLRDFLSECALPVRAPEEMQIVKRLPRDRDERVRSEWLTLIAMNQLDTVETLLMEAGDRDLVAGILAGRKNLRDRFNDGRA